MDGAATRVAVVTGAGSGIGRRTAATLAKDGFAVVLAGRRVANLDAGRAEILAGGGSACAVATDVTDEQSVAALFRTAVDRFGRVDLVFNNAGVNLGDAPPDRLDLEDWQRVVATNLTGVFLCVREAFRVMKRQSPAGGRIINNGSLSAHVPRPHSIAYTATKHGVTGLTRAASLDGREYGIACGQIDIGNAATDLTARMESGVRQADGSIRAEPTIAAEDVARAVSYMASLPLDANVQFLTVMATGMPFVGRG
jgi:NAD(P)-dependent dehydrogenase (short-subunit alcohol dehydrogenase family)